VRSLGVRGGRARTGCVGVISLDGDEFFTAMLTATLSRSARTPSSARERGVKPRQLCAKERGGGRRRRERNARGRSEETSARTSQVGDQALDGRVRARGREDAAGGRAARAAAGRRRVRLLLRLGRGPARHAEAPFRGLDRVAARGAPRERGRAMNRGIVRVRRAHGLRLRRYDGGGRVAAGARGAECRPLRQSPVCGAVGRQRASFLFDTEEDIQTESVSPAPVRRGTRADHARRARWRRESVHRGFIAFRGAIGRRRRGIARATRARARDDF